MLALLLRALIFVDILVAALLWPWAVARFGASGGVLAFVKLLVVPPTLLLACAYVVSRLKASPRPARIGSITLFAVVEEWLSLLALFIVIQPFQRWFMGSDAVGRLPSGKIPVLLVHGYMCNRGFWWAFRRKLRGRGHAVATVTLETPFSDIDILAAELDRRIEALCAETGATKVQLVTHSMGGLVARAYGRRKGWSRVDRFVALAAPHRGTVIAWFGLGVNARQMRPGSDWLDALNREPPPPVPTTVIWSAGDEVIAPQDSSQLAGARDIVVSATGHVAMAFSAAFADLVAAELVD
ncbi:MAG: alpha/beta fold hydrolase [Phyllobacteriaceae bacterium]|nr:alpha/beta fold hydrolase [Phyllobacteriaceae bacterium]